MYTFNKDKKRLEPSDTKCQYCDTEDSTDMEDNYFVPLFKETDRTNIIVYRSVKYSKIPVGVPRCKTCKRIHDKASTTAAWLGWGLALVFVILGFQLLGPNGMFTMIAGPFIGYGLKVLIEKKMVRNKEIYTKLEGAKETEAVQDLVLSGWSFTNPSP